MASRPNVVRHSKISPPGDGMGSLPMFSTPTPANVRCCSNSVEKFAARQTCHVWTAPAVEGKNPVLGSKH
jgi:hypothetical protein